jgi:hypothetical protein
MVRFYWYGLTVIYLACIAAGMLFGSVFGTAGMIVGIAFGATACRGLCDVRGQVRRQGECVLRILSVLFIVAIAWFIVTYSSVQP